MAFVKKWWLFIASGVVILILVAIRLFWTSIYIQEGEEQAERVQAFKDKVDSALGSMRSGEFPTAGDIMQAQERLEKIQEEGDQTANLWYSSSTALEEMHDWDPQTEFAVELLKRCHELSVNMGRTIAEKRNAEALRLEKVLVEMGRSDAQLPRYQFDRYHPLFCVPEDHELVDLTDDFRTVADTLKPWREYLISRRIHHIFGEVQVEVEGYALIPQEDTAPKVEEVTKRLTLDFLGPISFGEMIPATYDRVEEKEDESSQPSGGMYGMDSQPNPEPATRRRRRTPRTTTGGSKKPSGITAPPEYKGDEKRYQDIYPVTIEVTGPPRAIQELMRKFLASKDMLFVPRNCEIFRFSESETKPNDNKTSPLVLGAAVAGPGNELRILGDYEKPVRIFQPNLELTAEHEPPVKAVLNYHVYYFRGLRPEPEEEKEGKDGARAGNAP